jgi:hypothetical protein
MQLLPGALSAAQYDASMVPENDPLALTKVMLLKVPFMWVPEVVPTWVTLKAAEVVFVRY